MSLAESIGMGYMHEHAAAVFGFKVY